MPLLQWSDRLDVQDDQMNREHVELIRLMNAVHDANSLGSGKKDIVNALDALVRCVVRHFDHEEAHMESIGFEGLRAHKYIHKNLLERVGKYVQDFKDSQSSVLPDDFFEFLKFWLVSHIQGVDTKYSASAG